LLTGHSGPIAIPYRNHETYLADEETAALRKDALVHAERQSVGASLSSKRTEFVETCKKLGINVCVTEKRNYVGVSPRDDVALRTVSRRPKPLSELAKVLILYHRISGEYLYQYADEMAWREDHRREPNGLHFRRVTRAALRHPKSEIWRGYWQRSAA
jgi:hypothetical protein